MFRFFLVLLHTMSDKIERNGNDSGIELTVGYLRERFHELNRIFFGGELPEPRLMVSNARTQMGQFSCRRVRKGFFGRIVNTDFKIKISEFFIQTAEEIDDTLLHEMIHFLIAYRQQRDTSSHGPLFRKEMDRLNNMGRHITISIRTQRLTVAASNKRKQHLVLALKDIHGKHFLSVVHPSYKKYVERQITLVPSIIEHHWIVSNDETFNEYAQVRSLRARHVTKEKYEQLFKTVE